MLLFFKLPFQLYARAFLTLIPSGLGLMFMFFNFRAFLLNTVVWLRFGNAKCICPQMLKVLEG